MQINALKFYFMRPALIIIFPHEKTFWKFIYSESEISDGDVLLRILSRNKIHSHTQQGGKWQQREETKELGYS